MELELHRMKTSEEWRYRPWGEPRKSLRRKQALLYYQRRGMETQQQVQQQVQQLTVKVEETLEEGAEEEVQVCLTPSDDEVDEAHRRLDLLRCDFLDVFPGKSLAIRLAPSHTIHLSQTVLTREMVKDLIRNHDVEWSHVNGLMHDLRRMKSAGVTSGRPLSTVE